MDLVEENGTVAVAGRMLTQWVPIAVMCQHMAGIASRRTILGHIQIVSRWSRVRRMFHKSFVNWTWNGCW